MQQNIKEKPLDAIFFQAPVTGKVGGTSSQCMWMWPGLKVIGAGGAVKKEVFETVAVVSPDKIRLHNGVRLTGSQAIRSLRLSFDTNKSRPAG